MCLQLDSLDKAYGERVVFQGLSHIFPRSGVVAITGPSGCGKTTLLRLIAGLEAPQKGRIIYPGNARIAMVFQEDRLLPTLDARGNILAVLNATRGSVQLADQLLAACGLAGEETRYPAELSGGMRRRVAIARALAYDGDILLLDEPFRGLDAALHKQVAELLIQGQRHKLVLLVTHDPSDLQYADSRLSLR